MIDSCYEKIDYMDLVKLFGVNSENDFTKLKEYVNDLHKKGEIQWMIKNKQEILKNEEKEMKMNSKAILKDMINYVRFNERIL